jgi:hypothetical protein
VERYRRAHGEIALTMDAAAANRILLVLERLDQEGGLDPALGELREHIKTALVTKSSGDTDSAPSTE